MNSEISAYQQAKNEIPPKLVENDKLRHATQFILGGLAMCACAAMGIEKASEIIPFVTAGLLVSTMIMDAKSTVETLESARTADELGINNSVQETGLFLPSQPSRSDIYRGRGLFIDIAKIVLLVGAPVIGPIGLAGSVAGIGHSAGKALAALNNGVVKSRLDRAIEIQQSA
jgi:hypothetical protein